jgi:redox-sensitive bicupin YhaK (pirin superfamily)
MPYRFTKRNTSWLDKNTFSGMTNYLTEGQIAANGETLKSKDQARIDTDAPLLLKAQQQSELILIDVPSCKGWGYSSETLKGQKK